MHHVVYERLVADPEPHLRRVFEFLGLEHEPDAVNYGHHSQSDRGLGDPIGVKQHAQPTTESVGKWAVEIAADPARIAVCRDMIARLDPNDLAVWGHPLDTLWAPLDAAGAPGAKPSRKPLTRYRLQRRIIVLLRAQARRRPALRKLLETVRLATDVLLRE